MGAFERLELERAEAKINKLRAALKGAIDTWDHWYPMLPVCTEAEDDEFGAMLTARSAYQMTEPLAVAVDAEGE